MPRVKVLQPHPDLEAEGLAAGAEAEMSEPRAQALAARGLVAMIPAEIQAHPGAPERKRARAAS